MAENVEVILRLRGSRQFVAQATAAATSVDKVGKSTDTTAKKAGKFGAIMKTGFAAGAVGVGALALGAKSALAAFEESRKVTAQTGAVIKSTGGAAKVTANQVGNLAGAISAKTGMDDELIQSGANVLLTFSKIRNEAGKGNDIFSQTTGIMTDMSAALGQDAKSSAMQLGKALNNPTKGVAALQRVGVAFTDAQKKQIATLQKSGDTMGAQKIILRELKSEFGGSAVAQATATDKMKVAWGNAMESIGGALAPVVDKLLTGLIPVVNKAGPAIERFMGQLKSGEGVGGAVASGFRAVATAITAVYDAGKWVVGNWRDLALLLGIITPLILALTARIIAQSVATLAANAATKTMAVVTKGVTAAQWLWNAALTANPIGLVIAVLIALIAAVVLTYRKVAWFRNGVDAAFKWIVNAGKAMFSWFKSNWPLLVAVLAGPFGIAFLLIRRNFDKIKGAVRDVWNFVRSMFGQIKSFISGVFSGSFVSGIGRGLADWLNANTPFGDRVEFSVLGKHVGFTIPALAQGGTTTRGGTALVGERGPELVSLPRAATVFPTPSIAVAARRPAAVIHTQVYLREREIAEAIGRYTSDRLARR
jgi:hypothetical protein